MNPDPNNDNNFKRQQELQHEEEALRLRQEANHLESTRRIMTFSWLINTVFWLLGILEMLLVIRFLLRLFGANPANQFAQLINTLSDPFMAPFATLFISPTSTNGNNIFDLNIVIAIMAYTLLSYVLVSLIKFFFYPKF
jgi:YggT family protein